MATQGPNSPGTGAQSNLSLPTDWVTPENITSSDNAYATATMTDFSSTEYLIASNFGFSIPTGATIDGILVEVEVKCSSANRGSDYGVKLTRNAAAYGVGDDKATLTYFPTSDAYFSYGGAADLWGTTWTVAQVNASGFGLLFTAGQESGTNTSSVDHVRFTVYYTPGAVSGIPRGPFSKPFRGPFGGSIGW